VYSTYLGGTDGEQFGDAIAVDPLGKAYVTGETAANDFPTTPGGYDQKCGANVPCDSTHHDTFLSILNAAGTSLAFSSYLGGDNEEVPGGGNSIAVDHAGNIYLTGITQSPNFPTFPNNVYDNTCGTDGTCNAASPVDGLCGGGSPCNDVYVTRFGTGADLTIFKRGDLDPIVISSGNTIETYTIAVPNKGPATAGIFEVHDTLSSKAAFKILSVNLDPVVAGMCLIQGPKDIDCKATNLPANHTARITLRVKVLSLPGNFSETLTDKATVKLLNQIDPDTANNTAVVKTTVNP
jgi:uncharacterized repeat protein (TIGR01451 family)